MSDSIVVFRKRLLSYTETFIADQGRFLPRYQPVYVGYQEDASGLGLLEGSTRILLQDHSRLLEFDKLLLRRGWHANARWLDAIRARSPLLIHAHFFNDGLDAIELGARLDLPVVTTLHGHDITKHANTGSERLRQRFFDGNSRVIAVSRFIAQQALARGCPEQKLVQHYIGIDLERFTNEKQETDSPSLLFVGRLVEKKGCTYLLQAMQKLLPRFPELSLTIVGEGSLRAQLQAEAKARGLRVEFTGGQNAAQIRERLSRSWVFVAPSITAEDGDAEGLGMVFLEAQALKTPVASFRSGGVVEAVEDQVTALLCAEKDVEALADNIAALLENRELRHNMGLAGRRRVEEHFDIRRQCARLESIYAEFC